MNLRESAIVSGTAAACRDAVADFESYPEWQSAVRRVTVRSRAADGRGMLVDFEIDLKVKTVRYSLNYEFVSDELVRWTYAGGDIENVTGSYVFESRSDTEVEAIYELDLDLGFYVPGIVKKKVQQESMKRSVVELKERVEGPPPRG